MIGSDLVHIPGWSQPEGSRHKRFLNKLFLPAEQEMLRELPAFGEPLLWSMKEAAYKLIFRSRAVYRYAPKSLATHIETIDQNAVRGGVTYEGSRIITLTNIAGDYLHTLSVFEKDLGCLDRLKTLVVDRRRDKTDYLLPLDVGYMAITKDDRGVPQLDYPGSFVSLSHDGDKIAYAWIMEYTSG